MTTRTDDERDGTSASPGDLEGLREAIRRIDDELLALVRRRLDVACRVADTKRRSGMPVLDPAREAAVVRHAGEFAREHGLAEEDVRALYWAVVGLTRRAELTSP